MFIILTFCSVGAMCWWCYQRYRNHKAEQDIQQDMAQHAHKPLSYTALQNALAEADECGLGAEFRDYVHGITKHTGQPHIKVGHLLWIFDQLEAGERFTADMKIPEFGL